MSSTTKVARFTVDVLESGFWFVHVDGKPVGKGYALKENARRAAAAMSAKERTTAKPKPGETTMLDGKPQGCMPPSMEEEARDYAERKAEKDQPIRFILWSKATFNEAIDGELRSAHTAYDSDVKRIEAQIARLTDELKALRPALAKSVEEAHKKTYADEIRRQRKHAKEMPDVKRIVENKDSRNVPDYDDTTDEQTLILKIAQRASALASALASTLAIRYTVVDAALDITCVHQDNGGLKLAELLNTDDGNFGHDVFGIRRFLDRSSKHLGGQFSPRFSR